MAVWSVIKHDLASLIAQEDETAERKRSKDETDPIMMWSSMQQFAPEIRRERNKSWRVQESSSPVSMLFVKPGDERAKKSTTWWNSHWPKNAHFKARKYAMGPITILPCVVRRGPLTMCPKIARLGLLMPMLARSHRKVIKVNDKSGKSSRADQPRH